MALTTAQIQNAYVAFFNRPADVAGLTYWSSYAGSSGDLLNTFAKSAEYNALYAGLNNTQLVNAVYQNLFGRAPDPAGLTYWVTQLDTGKVTIGNAANTIQTGAQGSDKTIIDNKVAAATAFTTALDTTAEIVGYAGASSSLLGQVKSWLSGVTADSASLEAAKTALQALTDTIKGGTNEAGATYVLKTEQDVLTGSNGDDFFRAVVGKQEGTQDQTTLNSSDIIDGGAGSDTLIVNMTGSYGGSARIKGIETLQLGSNVAGAVNFDYNVNAGANEVSDVNTVVYDQITTGETLNVINVTPTAKGGVIPTLVWANELNSVAGTIGVTYRQASVAGDASKPDNQNIVLKNVNNGQINIARGIETITIESAGDIAANTLATSTGFDGNGADLVSETALGNGVNDDSTLTKVIVKGEKAFGKVATVNTNDAAGETGYGLTNRINNGASDIGNSADTASASNLVSVAATVKEINAADANGGVAMRFTSRVDGNAVDVTFTGGKGADYIEFQRGNVSAAGGDGADTFAFVNSTLTNFDFGSADTITGGAGSDTIQLGVNGVGTVVANTTEFNNKTGIDVLDLRGQSNTVTLADAFVAGADAGTFTVRTDKIVQTSASSTANTAPSNATNNAAREDASVNTIVLTELADNRAIEFIGGSGSDRVVVDNASANQFTKLNGGSNDLAGSNDSLTVVNTSVLDANDVANIKGFELLNLVESAVGNSAFNITLSEAFVLNNAKGLVIASVTNTYGVALGNGDVVNLEISDLLSNNVAKPSIADRTINIQNLINAGVTVNFQVNGVTVSTNQLAGAAAPLAARFDLINAPAATILDDVPGNLPAQAATTPLVAGQTFTGTAGINDTFTGAIAALSGTTITGTAADTETLTLTTAGTVAINNGTTGGTISNIDNLVLSSTGANTVTFAATGSGITSITGGAGADDVTLDNLATTASVSLGDGNDTLRASGVLTGALAGGAGVSDILTGTATGALDISGATVSGFEVLDFGNSATNVTMTRAQFAGFSSFANFTAGVAAADGITFKDAGAVTLNTVVTTYNLANGTNTVDATGAANYLLTGGTGADTFNFGAALTASDTVAGGLGSDVLTVTGAATGSTNITGVETIRVNYATAATFTTGAIAPGVESTINLAGSTAAVTLDASSYVATTKVTIIDGQGNDVLTVGGGSDAQRALTTVTLSTGGADTITLANGSFDATTTNYATINNFTTTAGTNQDKIAGLGIVSYQTVAAAGGVTAANSLVELETASGGLVSTFDAGNGGVVETAIDNVLGSYGGSDGSSFYTIVYGTGAQAGNAALYQVQVTTAATGITAANIAVELVGVFNGVTADSFVQSNFL